MKPLIRKLQSYPPELADFVVVKRSKRAKRLALRLDTRNRVFDLVVPKGVSYSQAHDFALDHQDWMQDKLQELPPPIRLQDGAHIPIFGKRHKIRVIYDEEFRKTDIIMKDGFLLVFTNKADPGPRILRFLKTQAKERLSEMSYEKARAIRKRIKSIYVRDTKSRWGSCSEDGALSYSWRLIFAPQAAMDYVVAHEIAHLKHMDHSDNFWDLCTQLSDDFAEGHYWMRHHGHELMRYGL